MKRIVLCFLIVALFALVKSNAQTAETLRSQLDFCKKESVKMESTIETYKKLLEIQGSDIQTLKTTVQSQETEIKNLKLENERLTAVSIELLNLASTYESLGKYQEAIEIYKMLIRTYPSSMEAISARLRVIDLKKKETVSK
jgi:tetratricopeptide (TPR) repeat protein